MMRQMNEEREERKKTHIQPEGGRKYARIFKAIYPLWRHTQKKQYDAPQPFENYITVMRSNKILIYIFRRCSWSSIKCSQTTIH